MRLDSGSLAFAAKYIRWEVPIQSDKPGTDLKTDDRIFVEATWKEIRSPDVD
jgi:hypothetical protein